MSTSGRLSNANFSQEIRYVDEILKLENCIIPFFKFVYKLVPTNLLKDKTIMFDDAKIDE